MKTVVIRWGVLLLLAIGPVQAANKTTVELLLGQMSAKPGSSVDAALRMKSPPGWHTYWRNGGDSGFQTTVEWELPPGITVSPFEWPVPQKLSITKLDSYVYEGEILLPFKISIASNTAPGSLNIKGSVDWLECDEDECVPARAGIQTNLTVAAENQPSPQVDLIKDAREKIPKADAARKARAEWTDPESTENRGLIIEWVPKEKAEKPDFFPYESEDYKVAPQTEVLTATDSLVRIKTKVTKGEGKWPDHISGIVLDRTGGKEPAAAEVTLTPESSSGKNSGDSPAPSKSNTTIWVALVLAFLGGLILNVMPCVLPVVALKILSFVNQTREEPARRKQLGLVYGAGVLTSFLLLAIVAIVVQKSGNQAAWGMQMQNPVFVVVLVIILLLASLNLFGVFELALGGRTLGKASELASREGPAGAFFNGVFTTVLATPCTAPALTVALGFAYAQPPIVLTLILLMVGVGLAFPYVLLTFFPAGLRLLPKPGVWMEKFKQAMAFPILATMVWLFWVGNALLGSNSALWLGILLVLLSFTAWTYGQFLQRGTKHPAIAWFTMILSLIAVIYVLERQLQWRNPPEQMSGVSSSTKGLIDWQPWSAEAVEKARREGHVVLVDFTAKWCATCQSNKEFALETEAVHDKLKEVNGVTFKADFTSRSPVIAAELKRHESAGVPLNLVYPPDVSKPPIILPSNLFLPWQRGKVLEALDQAGKQQAPK
jgi:thiol:disulfide interchange protein